MLNLFKGGIKGRLDLARLGDRLFLTIRRIGGNNSAGGGRGERKMKKGIVLATMLLGALVLVGWGCGQRSAAPADTNSDTHEVSETSSDSTPEATSDTTGEVPAGWIEYENERYGFSFQYPEGWKIETFDDDPSRVAIIAPDNPAAEGQEPLPEISVLIRSNSERLALREFYERAQESIFEDAMGGVTAVDINGNRGFSLLDVSGEISTDLVVLAHEMHVAEFELTRDGYREEFDMLVNSFQFLGGE